MPEQDNQIVTIEAAKLSIGNRLRKGMALAGTVISMAGGIMQHEIIFPDKAQAEMECTTTTTTTEENGVVTTTEATECTDSSDTVPATKPPKTEAKPDKSGPQPDKENHKPDKAKKQEKQEAREDARQKKANSQKGFPGYNMEDSWLQMATAVLLPQLLHPCAGNREKEY